MAEKTIASQVEELTTGLTPAQEPYLQSFLAGLADRLSKAEFSFVSGLFLFAGLWVGAYLVSKGLVDEVAQGGVRIPHASDLLIAVPPVLGFVAYTLSAAVSAAMVLEEVVRELYVKMLPNLGNTQLSTLFWSHTFVGVEQHDVVTTRSNFENNFSQCMSGAVVFFCWFFALVGILHVTYLASAVHRWPAWETLISGALGGMLWFRGAVMIYHRTATP